TCYRYSSGGKPEIIPELSYKEFLNFHKKFYHPSNSYIYLYGNGDINKQLEFIDKEYLSNFEKAEIASEILIQLPFEKRQETVAYYPILKDDVEENRSYLSLNYVLGENIDPELYLMTGILGILLIDMEGAPLKKALIDGEIGEDIFSMSTGGIQPGFSIVAKNSSMDKKEEFENIVINTLEELAQNGIDRKLIEAAINIVEFNLREAMKFPTKGLIYNMQALDSWLYDDNPTTHLQYDATIEKLKQNMDSGYFEEFIREKLIENPHSSLVIVNPKKDLGDIEIREMESELEEYKNSLTEEDIQNLIKENEELKEMQLSDDTEEAKATIPRLSISHVDRKVEEIPQEIIKKDNTTLLFHNIFTSKISYLDLYFDTSMVEEDLIPYISLLSNLLGKLDTKNKSYEELSKDIYVNTGGIVLDASAYSNKDNSEIYYPKFYINGRAIGEENTITMLELINEIITETKIEDKKRIRELLQQMKSRMEMGIFDIGHSLAAGRVSSYFSPSAQYGEKLKGLEYFWFISEILKDFDKNSDEILENLNKVYREIFNINNLIISFTGDKEDFSIIEKNLNIIMANLNTEEFQPQKYSFTNSNLNEGILSSANVQYVSKGYNFKDLGYEYSGKMDVLSTILSRDYLHNRIRAQGGAYGAGISFGRSGIATTFSYRDPNLEETLAVYDNMADYVENLNLNEEDLTTYIIGTISKLDPAITPHGKGSIATSRYITGLSYDEVQKTKDEVLDTKLEDLKALAPMLRDTMEKDYLCVLGNENRLKENENVFKELVKLNK
ncbi:MAG: insulinase family protein, partial [Tissierellia bacterium]|nr:insulinase family protein [Tissierellia bacterium]